MQRFAKKSYGNSYSESFETLSMRQMSETFRYQIQAETSQRFKAQRRKRQERCLSGLWKKVNLFIFRNLDNNFFN